MPANPPDLAELRRRLDALDDRVHDLLIERAAVVEAVAAAKKDGAGAFYQPAREAQILRRLAARHRGELPFAAVVRIWRELLAATVRLETPFAVAVFAPPGGAGFWDLARDHYGSQMPMSAYGTKGQVIRAVSEGGAAVGILPMPEEGDPDPWWRHLVSHSDGAPRVIARLPFGAIGNARSDGDTALVVGRAASQETGADRTLFAAEAAAGISRARLLRLMSAAGLACTFFAAWEHAEGALDLIEVEGFVTVCDPRIAVFRTELGAALHRLLALGGYAIPLPEAALLPGLAKG